MARLALLSALAACLVGCHPGAATTQNLPTVSNVAAGTPATSAASTEATVRAILGQQFNVPPQNIDFDKNLSDPPLHGDDLDVVEIVIALEERFEIEISDAVFEKHAGGELGEESLALSPQKLVHIVDECRQNHAILEN